MFDEIKEFMLTDNGIKILGFIVTIVVAYITAKLTSKNTKKSLTTQHFKEKGVNIQEKVLKFWCGLVMGNFNILNAYKEAIGCKDKKLIKDDTDILTEIQKESYIYSSPKTIKAIKEYMQYLYKNKTDNIESEEETTNKSKESILDYTKSKIKFSRMFVLIARIISRMKYDFTGEKVDELDIIKIKITDFNLFTRVICRIMLWYYNLKDILIKLIVIILLLIVMFIIYKNIYHIV